MKHFKSPNDALKHHVTGAIERGEKIAVVAVIPKLKCVGMHDACCNTVTHIDNKGYIYCERHGLQRRSSGTPCRKLRPSELKTLELGQPIKKY
jgi:hypothetical protein